MRSHRHPRSPRALRHIFAASILAVAGVLASASGASAAPLEAPVDAPPPDRLIEVDGPMPTIEPPAAQRSANTATTEWTSEAIPIPAQYLPEPGQTVTINYNDGVVVHTGVIEDDNAPSNEARAAALAACTHSLSMGLPTIAYGPWRVTVAMSLSVSSACASGTPAVGRLDWQWGAIPQLKAQHQTSTVSPGSAVNFNVSWNCINSSNTNWRGNIYTPGNPAQYTAWYSRQCGG